jgi:hypothetical protein
MSDATSRDPLRAHVLELLRGGHAHATFDDAVADLAVAERGAQPKGVPHTAWQLVEHIRITQDDILRFSMNVDGRYQSPEWPAGYWPAGPVPPSAKAWTESLKAVADGRATMERLVADPSNDLLAPFSWGDGQTLLREALLLADHTSYHVGQLILVRRILGAWSD